MLVQSSEILSIPLYIYKFKKTKVLKWEYCNETHKTKEIKNFWPPLFNICKRNL